MKKPFHFTEVSDSIKCTNCGTSIKKNVITRKKGRPDLCYKCHIRLVVVPKRSKRGK